MLPRDLSGHSNHDADCLRRKAKDGWQYVCTCRLTDEQIHDALYPGHRELAERLGQMSADKGGRTG